MQRSPEVHRPIRRLGQLKEKLKEVEATSSSWKEQATEEKMKEKLKEFNPEFYGKSMSIQFMNLKEQIISLAVDPSTVLEQDQDIA